MKKVMIVFGSNTGNTQTAAENIAEKLSSYNPEMLDVASASPEKLQEADVLILGTSTWGLGDLQDDWESFLPSMEKVNLNGKKVALFGLGDSEGYSDTFVSAMGTLYDAVVKQGAEVIGQLPTSDYSFSASDAEKDGQFVGLALDEDNESAKSDARIAAWTASLETHLK